jgi:UDP-4-amino-4-deoxy-L-arabinose formyltransferase/UDP-glucuronic acid dehydrogenase (UDP-4-keto-hexauronic acid decarboxylating)
MKVILCGYHWAGCEALIKLLEKNHDVFVYTHETPNHIPSLSDLCIKNKIPFSFENISNSTIPFVPDIICSIYYKFIIKKNIIEACNRNIFNVHPSLLPKYRGCGSITWAIINNETSFGFTYHYIDEGCDTGNIIYQKELPIRSWDTQLSLYYRAMFESMNYFYDAFDKVILGDLGTRQIGEASYYPRKTPYEGLIDETWNNDFVERFIRAMYYPPMAPAKFKGLDIFTFQDYLSAVDKFDLARI